eukprot:scaffold63252_cov46-Prasinocladus_malaysianus.AAC.1
MSGMPPPIIGPKRPKDLTHGEYPLKALDQHRPMPAVSSPTGNSPVSYTRTKAPPTYPVYTGAPKGTVVLYLRTLLTN